MRPPACPACDRPLSVEHFEGHYGARVELDLCHPCELIWFDKLENIRLSASGVLTLMRAMSQGLDGARPVLPEALGCPRCEAVLRTEPRRKGPATWQVRACPEGHGQLVRYLDYLTERDCVKPLSGSRLEELRQHVQQVRCSGCGASVSLTGPEAACTHCGAALSVLDAAATAEALSRLQEEQERRSEPDPDMVAADMVMARLRTETTYKRMDRIYREKPAEVAVEGLVEAGLLFLASLFD